MLLITLRDDCNGKERVYAELDALVCDYRLQGLLGDSLTNYLESNFELTNFELMT